MKYPSSTLDTIQRILGNGPIARNSISTLIFRVVNIGLGFITTLAVAYFLGAEGYGAFAYGVGITMLGAMFARLGVHTQVIRLSASTLHQNRIYRRGVFIFGLCTALGVTIVTSFVLILYFVTSGVSPIVANAGVIGALAAPIIAVAAVFQGMLRARLKAAKAYAPEYLFVPSFTLAAISLLAFSGNLNAATALLAFACGWVAATIILIRLTMRLPTPQNSSLNSTNQPIAIRWREWSVSTVMIVIGGIIFTAMGQIETVFLGTMFGPAEVGIYAIALRFAQFATLPGFAISSAFIPVLTELISKHDHNAVAHRIDLSARANAAATLLIGCTVGVVAWFLLPLINIDFTNARLPMVIMCIGYIVQAAFGRPYDILCAADKPAAAAKASAITFVISIFMIVAIVPLWGAVGASTVTAFSVIAHSILLCYIVRAQTGHRSDVFAALRKRSEIHTAH